MKIILLSDINSSHTRKWAISLAKNGFNVGLFSLNKNNSEWFKNNPDISYLNEGGGVAVEGKNEISKIEYIKALPELKKIINSFHPGILHAHYATSYGLLGALSGFHPFLISVWGSDVYEFPRKSFLHKYMLKRNLRKAEGILSTSNCMAEELKKYSKKKVYVTPFGIDINLFKPQQVKSLFNEGDIVIGTVKSLEPKYGINYLIDSFAILHKRQPSLPLKLLIVGKGSQEEALKALVKKHGVEDRVKFVGWVKPEDVPVYHNMLDVYVALSVSDSESFGVAAIEASACGKPVVVSDVSGFKEVVENGNTGIIVPRKNAEAAANAIEKVILDKQFAVFLGAAGRKRVEKLYNWKQNLDEIIKIYNDVNTMYKGHKLRNL